MTTYICPNERTKIEIKNNKLKFYHKMEHFYDGKEYSTKWFEYSSALKVSDFLVTKNYLIKRVFSDKSEGYDRNGTFFIVNKSYAYNEKKGKFVVTGKKIKDGRSPEKFQYDVEDLIILSNPDLWMVRYRRA